MLTGPRWLLPPSTPRLPPSSTQVLALSAGVRPLLSALQSVAHPVLRVPWAGVLPLGVLYPVLSQVSYLTSRLSRGFCFTSLNSIIPGPRGGRDYCFCVQALGCGQMDTPASHLKCRQTAFTSQLSRSSFPFPKTGSRVLPFHPFITVSSSFEP